MTRELSTGKRVDLERFAAIVDAYGADADAWPAEERAGALALLEVSAKAVELRAEAARLDGFLDELPELAPSVALSERILEEAPAPARGWTERWAQVVDAVWPFGPSWQPVAALATAAVLGITFGLVMPESSAPEGEAMVVADLALDTGEDYWSDTP